jgi:hypothetical protein
MALRSFLNIPKWHVFPKTLPAVHRMSSTNNGMSQPLRVLVVGGSYAGLSATLNLLDLCNGKAPRFTADLEHNPQPVSVKITIVDERDGFCKRASWVTFFNASMLMSCCRSSYRIAISSGI